MGFHPFFPHPRSTSANRSLICPRSSSPTAPSATANGPGRAPRRTRKVWSAWRSLASSLSLPDFLAFEDEEPGFSGAGVPIGFEGGVGALIAVDLRQQ